MPADYYDRQERRRERLEKAASLTKQAADRAFSASHRLADSIPLGQPILIGHHSERHARRDADRIRRGMERGIDLSKKAEDYARRAASIGEGGISSDAPDAVDLLADKVAKLEKQRDGMKECNRLFRKGGWRAVGEYLKRPNLEEWIAGKEADAKRDPWFCGVPFRPYELTNLGARIRQAKQRTAQISREADRPSETREINGWTVEDDADENRIALKVGRRLTPEEYRTVRGWGFVWCRTSARFQRKRSNAARYAAERITATIPGEAPPTAPEAAIAEEVPA